MTKYSRLALVLTVALILALFAAIGCSRAAEPTATPKPVAAVAPTATPRPVAAAPTPAPAKVALTEWIVGTAEDPTLNVSGLTPGGAMGAARAQWMAHEYLMTFDGYDFRSKPRVAESYEWKNPTTLVYHLRKGLKGHKPGTEFTSADVKYTMDTGRTNPQLSTFVRDFADVKSIDTPDNYTVQINFAKANAFFPESRGTTPIIPKERKGNEVAYDEAPWSYGWYKPLEWKKDKPVKFEAHKDHYMGVPEPSRLTLIWMRDSSTRVAALLAGEAQVIESMPLAQVRAVRGRSDLAVASIPGSRAIFWQFNMTKTPFSNLKVRQAMNYALNKEVVVKDLMEGFAVQVASVLPRGWSGYELSSDLKPYEYDPVKAVKLLQEAGYDRGFAFDFMASSGVFQKDQEIAEVYASMWEAVGLKPRIRITERGTIFDLFYKGDYQISGTFQWGTGIEPDSFFDWELGTYSPGQRVPELAKAHKLMEEVKGELDVRKRAKVWAELNRISYDLAVGPFSHAQDELYALNKATNWIPMPAWGSMADVPTMNYAKLAGYGPNYEKWSDSLASNYWK